MKELTIPYLLKAAGEFCRRESKFVSSQFQGGEMELRRMAEKIVEQPPEQEHVVCDSGRQKSWLEGLVLTENSVSFAF